MFFTDSTQELTSDLCFICFFFLFHPFFFETGGTLDRMEIYKALGVVSGYSAQTGMSLVELDAMIDEADVDGGGTIDKEEFVKMMSHVTHGVATFDPW